MNSGGYDLTQLLPALETLWNQDRAKAEEALRYCIEDAGKRGLKFTKSALETAWAQLNRGEHLDHLGSVEDGVLSR